jgi:transcriptional regulator with GAF, ATPase, and Fis domain
MATELRKTGIEVVGAMPWGTHFCHFYDTKDDLLETLVPYVKAGLESNEFCVWVISDLTEQEASNALTQAVPDFQRHLADGSIEIILDREWYTNGGAPDLDRVRSGWNRKLAQALDRGYAGMRVTGSTLWLEKKDWWDFNAYEDELNRSITNLPMTCLCSYPLAASGATEVLDVARTHQFAVARRGGNWEVVETPGLKEAKAEIQKLNQELEQRVVERTRELTAATEELRRALDEIDKLRQRLESENAHLREEVRATSDSHTILGNSAGVRRVLDQVEMVAPTDATVLVLGETGVGKELVARAIHARSPWRERPLVKVNCTAIPRELFESEFFGHVKGAFSGALKDRGGRFQLADGGTLFLDEVGDLPVEMQPKLLRVLQDGEFEAVGDDKTRRAHVRIIAASNRDLESAVRAGQFRQDLYYRLSIFPTRVPPLRERKEDIPILAAHFLEAACKRFNRPGLRLTDSQIQQLISHDWPGNVRELQNVVERAVIAARSGSLQFDVPQAPQSGTSVPPQSGAATMPADPAVIPDTEIKRRERANIIAALRRSNGRIYGRGGAAQLLGVKPTTLSARVKKLGIKQVS